ncbi:MAG: ABC transporter ATP-binding protein [Pseudomonadota bacterium]|nr:ABC transporter ATP-binding protein [Pseudomonadota bacterium]
MSTDEIKIDLETRGVTKRFGHFTAVDSVDLAIPKGDFFSILGPSGCGKTTLLRMIAGFEEPDSGDILIRGESVLGIPPNRRPANMVFQHLALFPMMTVAENIAYGLKRRKVPPAEIGKRVQAALERVSLPDSGPKKIDQLSGGQQQRIAIARCLVLEPKVLLLDEPLGALDLKLREHMKVELKQLQNEVGTTFIYITHDQSEALVMSDRVAVMNEGRFEQVGAPSDLYYSPRSAFVADFVGDANRWQARINRVENGACEAEVEGGLVLHGIAGGKNTLQTGQAVEVFVRPEAVRLSRADGDVAADVNRLNCRVTDRLFNGANSRALMVDVDSGKEIQVALPQTGEFRDLARGEKIGITWGREQTLCFPAG